MTQHPDEDEIIDWDEDDQEDAEDILDDTDEDEQARDENDDEDAGLPPDQSPSSTTDDPGDR